MSTYYKEFADKKSLQVGLTESGILHKGGLELSISPLDADGKDITQSQEINAEMRQQWKEIVSTVQQATGSAPSYAGITTGMTNDCPSSVTFRVSGDLKEAEETVSAALLKIEGMQKEDVEKLAFANTEKKIHMDLDRSGLPLAKKLELLDGMRTKLSERAA